MSVSDLKNRLIRFDPEPDLETVAELPGKDIMQDVLCKFGDAANGARLIQDSHGWCFYVRGDDKRRYLLELTYVATKADASIWILSCSRCADFRFWEWFRSRSPDVGNESNLLTKCVGFLVSYHGYERTDA